MLERTARDNQGWTIKGRARKEGLSVEKKLGEARRVRKTSLRRSEQ